jgi:hypothetical protein
MSLSGTRGLIRISTNPDCDLQAAMVVEGVREPDFYRQVTGEVYPGEYGERESARRRGAKFEANLHANNAALLRRVLGPKYGWDPDVMTVRNFAEELPGARDGVRSQRLYRMRLILRDLAAGRPVPHVVIQPQLHLRAGRAGSRFMFVSPDFVVLDARTGMYAPGEEKSFIVRDGVAERSDLDRTRRQAAAQIVALREEARRVRLADRVHNRAVFVFATPYGLSPAPAVEESLDAAIREIESAIDTLEEATRRHEQRRALDGARLAMLVDDIPINFQDSCFGSCILATKCKERHERTTRTLGDRAVEVFGNVPITRVAELIAGASPATTFEAELVPRLREAQRILRRIA